MIMGETIILIEERKVGVDPFGHEICEPIESEVRNVIIGSPTTEAVVQDLNIEGKHLAFVLGIPKGDDHNWTDKTVLIRGEKFRTYGFPLVQTDGNVPGPWNTQVKVERYE